MSQTFNLQLAADTLATDAYQLGVTTEQLLQITIEVQVAVCQQPEPMLCLTYHVELPAILADLMEWPLWSPENVTFTDYLWQQTCLECFIATDTSSYIEINASPSGAYAVYEFSGYRTPDILPPTPLLLNEQGNRAYIRWLTPERNQLASTSHHYQHHFGIPLAQLPNDIVGTPNHAALIHPCVILKIDETLLYFAPMHAAPPDFHNRALWSDFSA